jgi:hypothetical protein
MNRMEMVAATSPPRRWSGRWREPVRLLRLARGRLADGERTTRIGCGADYGTQLIIGSVLR